MKLICVDFVRGKYLGYKSYHDQINFPLITVFLLDPYTKKNIEILADRIRWKTSGGDKLKKTEDTILLSVGVYSVMHEGKKIIYHVFEDILEVS